MTKKFTHIDSEKPNMVDVGEKQETNRIAIAKANVQLPKEMAEHVQNGEVQTLKGPVFQTAIIAGIQGAKKTSDLIPLCHNLLINKINIDIQLNNNLNIEITCEARTFGKTGVEMEALTGASVAALTVYDMCKAFSHNIEIQNVRLISKTGGESDFSQS